MASLLASTANTRAVFPGSLRVLRSDAPVAPTDGDVQWLLRHSVTLLIDLRSDGERLRRPCPLAAHPAFTCLHMPVTGGNAMPASPQAVPHSYLQMADAQMHAIVKTVEDADTGVMFFCTAGKDRTGVVSALLQQRAGMPREAIIADYLLSGGNLQAQLAAFGEAHPEIDPAIYTPCEAHMALFLDAVTGF